MYSLEKYMLPYWLPDFMYYEAVLPLQEPDGRMADIGLLWDPDQIESVVSADHQKVFTEGTDYVLAGNKLRILPGSAIETVPYAVYFPQEPNEKTKPLNPDCGTGYVFFSEGDCMHRMQLAVSYRHRGWMGAPMCKADLLPRTQDRLRQANKLQLCVFGDSICVGGNSSGFVGAAPMAPIWAEMLVQQLEKTFPACQIRYENPSLGGKTSGWGAAVASQAVGYGPELCIIGFGMNDGTKRIDPEEYGENIKAIMAAARVGNPDCEFVLIAPILPNRLVGRFLGYQAEYLPVLLELEGPGVAVADMTGFHKRLLQRKRYMDMSGNNVNHPNDFLARAYAQVLWQTIVGY